MDKTIAICKLQEIADHHLLGPGGWPACGESVPAFFRTIRDLGLDEAVQGGFTRSTTLGNELSVELMTVFAGCWDSVNVPNILAEHGYIEWSEAEELWELPESEFEPKLRLLVVRAYREFRGRSKLPN